MKIEFKQSFMEGEKGSEKEFKIKYKGKAEQAEVPVYFLFLATFFNLLKSGLIKILEVSNEEFESMPEKYKEIAKGGLSEQDQSIIEAAIDEATMKEESEEDESDEGEEDDKEPSDSDSVDSSDKPSSSEPANEGEQNPPASDEVKKSEEEIQAEKDKAEYDSLHEKAKRLNKNEKARYEALKSKLGIEG